MFSFWFGHKIQNNIILLSYNICVRITCGLNIAVQSGTVRDIKMCFCVNFSSQQTRLWGLDSTSVSVRVRLSNPPESSTHVCKLQNQLLHYKCVNLELNSWIRQRKHTQERSLTRKFNHCDLRCQVRWNAALCCSQQEAQPPASACQDWKSSSDQTPWVTG